MKCVKYSKVFLYSTIWEGIWLSTACGESKRNYMFALHECVKYSKIF